MKFNSILLARLFFFVHCLLSSIGLLLFIELGLYLLFSYPSSLQFVARSAALYYVDWERDILQMSKACANYDPKLTYRLTGRACIHHEREYQINYFMNSAGLRGTEESLTAAQIIAIGDSYSFGWGVKDQDNYPTLLANSLKTKVLNASVPSYGTEREMRLLETLDSSSAQYLIIQYSGNDVDENRAFIENNYIPVTSSLAEYEQAVTWVAKTRPYYLGKYTKRFLPILWRQVKHTTPSVIEFTNAEGRLFLDVLSAFTDIIEEKKLIVFNLGNQYSLHPSFKQTLTNLLQENPYPEPLKNMIILDFSSSLDANDFFYYDDHLKASGHRKIADELIQTINANR